MISVAICTYNPPISQLLRVLDALKAQTLPVNEWELLIVDNGSEKPIQDAVNLDWHSNWQYFYEKKIGLTHARLCAIAKCRGELIVFVDDDNILRSDYLEKVLIIAKQHTMLGAWSGQVLPEYEIPLPKELEHLVGALCLRRVDRDVWGNKLMWGLLPWGAGMCIRRVVFERYYQHVIENPLRLSLGHAGGCVSCHDDTDLALTSADIGLGTGLFHSLILTHLIAARRLNEGYLLKYIENSASSFIVLRKIRGIKIEQQPKGIARWIDILRYWQAAPEQQKAEAARRRGEAKGHAIITIAPPSGAK